MKYIKKYENNIDEPKVGDYVVIYDDILDKFDEDIFQINDMEVYNPYDELVYMLDNATNDYLTSSHTYRDNIKFWSKNIEDAEVFLSSNKYNI